MAQRERRHKAITVGLEADIALAAVRMSRELETRTELLDAIRGRLATATPRQRERIAWAVVRRLFPESKRELVPTPLHELLSALPDEAARRHLLLYATSRREPLLLAIMGDVFFPYFVLNAAPKGTTRRQFAVERSGQLFETDQVVTHAALARYAQRQWGLRRRASTQLALRTLRAGEALDATWVVSQGVRCLGYFPAGRTVEWPALAYCLYAACPRSDRRWPADRLANGDLARLFLLSRMRLQLLLRECREHGLVATPDAAGGFVELACRDTTEAVTVILGQL